MRDPSTEGRSRDGRSRPVTRDVSSTSGLDPNSADASDALQPSGASGDGVYSEYYTLFEHLHHKSAGAFATKHSPDTSDWSATTPSGARFGSFVGHRAPQSLSSGRTSKAHHGHAMTAQDQAHPKIGSSQLAAEIAEVYQMAMSRGWSVATVMDAALVAGLRSAEGLPLSMACLDRLLAENARVRDMAERLNRLRWFGGVLGADDTNDPLEQAARRFCSQQAAGTVFRGLGEDGWPTPYLSQFLMMDAVRAANGTGGFEHPVQTAQAGHVVFENPSRVSKGMRANERLAWQQAFQMAACMRGLTQFLLMDAAQAANGPGGLARALQTVRAGHVVRENASRVPEGTRADACLSWQQAFQMPSHMRGLTQFLVMDAVKAAQRPNGLEHSVDSDGAGHVGPENPSPVLEATRSDARPAWQRASQIPARLRDLTISDASIGLVVKPFQAAALLLAERAYPRDPGLDRLELGDDTRDASYLLGLMHGVAICAAETSKENTAFARQLAGPEAIAARLHHILSGAAPDRDRTAAADLPDVLSVKTTHAQRTALAGVACYVHPSDTRYEPALLQILDNVRIHNSRAAKTGAMSRETACWHLPMPSATSGGLPPPSAATFVTQATALGTVLKAFFNMSDAAAQGHPAYLVRPEDIAFVPGAGTLGPGLSNNLLSLRTHQGLSLEGELNKLMWNVSLGGSIAGIQAYSDYMDAAQLGETVAIEVLRERILARDGQDALSVTIPLLIPRRLPDAMPGLSNPNPDEIYTAIKICSDGTLVSARPTPGRT